MLDKQPLPSEILTEPLSDGVRYRLPRLSRGGCFGIVALAFGASLLFFGVLLVANAVQEIAFPWLALGLLLASVPPFLAVLWLWRLAVLALAGHAEVTLTDGKLWSTWRAGPLRWSHWRAAHDVRRLWVSSMEAPPAHGEILTEGETGPPLRLAAGYPTDWLLALARDLARSWAQAAPSPGRQTPDVQTGSPPPLKDSLAGRNVLNVILMGIGFVFLAIGAGSAMEVLSFAAFAKPVDGTVRRIERTGRAVYRLDLETADERIESYQLRELFPAKPGVPLRVEQQTRIHCLPGEPDKARFFLWPAHVLIVGLGHAAVGALVAGIGLVRRRTNVATLAR